MTSKNLWLTIALILFTGIGLVRADAPRSTPAETREPTKSREETWPFFAMDTAVGKGMPDEVAQRVAGLGYVGLGWTSNQLPEMQAACQRHQLRLFAVYMGMNLDDDSDQNLIDVIRELKDQNTILWLTISARQWNCSDVAGDALAMTRLQKLADEAKRCEAKIALYPHTGIWLERFDDATRVAQLVNRSNLGTTFNLCHFLKVDRAERLTEVLENGQSKLMLVTINGADQGGQNWQTLIQPLDKGSYDPGELLRSLQKINYRGPIGLQGFGIRGDPIDNLSRSLQRWRQLKANIESQASSKN